MLRNIVCASVATIWLGACTAGPSDGEFVEACMKSNATEVATAAICQCGAREARKRVSPQHFQAMVMHMQGKKQEAEQLLGDLSFEDRAKFAMEQFEVLGACLNEK